MSEKDTKSKISSEIQELSEKIRKAIKIDKETGIGNFETNVFEENLPEGLSIDQVKTYNNYVKNLVVAGKLAFGQESIDTMVKAKKLESTSLTMPLEGRDSVEYHCKREQPYNYSITNDSGTHYGDVTSKVSMRASANSSSQLKHVTKLIHELGLEKLGGK